MKNVRLKFSMERDWLTRTQDEKISNQTPVSYSTPDSALVKIVEWLKGINEMGYA